MALKLLSFLVGSYSWPLCIEKGKDTRNYWNGLLEKASRTTASAGLWYSDIGLVPTVPMDKSLIPWFI